MAASDCVAAPLTPESPEVRASVERGLEYLATSREPRLGGKAIIGLAYLQATHSSDHPKIAEAVETIRAQLAQGEKFETDIYSAGLVIIFLCNLDAEQYRPEIEAVMQYLINRQKAHGGWGYPDKPTGDTSMTQYGVLSLWEAERAGFETPIDVWVKVCNWLLRTQDPGGGFSYQGLDPGTFERVAQPQIRASMATAGLGSVYICQNHLRLPVDRDAADPNVPASLKIVRQEEDQKEAARPLTSAVSARRVAEAQRDGDRWMQDHYRVNPGGFLYYYLYALERYQTFKEVSGHGVGAIPNWYDDGARMLLDSQEANGHWSCHLATGPACDTAFAILFLVRSTRQSLDVMERYGAGTLVGGRGLPEDTRQIELRQGRVVVQPLAGPAEDLLEMLEDPTSPDFLRAVEGFRDVMLTADESTLSEQTLRLRQLLAGKRPEARIVAIEALARQRNLDDVPLLIGALDDPDARVVLAVRDALRRLSRQPDGFGLPDQFGDAQRRTSRDLWKNWYRTIRPDAKFAD